MLVLLLCPIHGTVAVRVPRWSDDKATVFDGERRQIVHRSAYGNNSGPDLNIHTAVASLEVSGRKQAYAQFHTDVRSHTWTPGMFTCTCKPEWHVSHRLYDLRLVCALGVCMSMLRDAEVGVLRVWDPAAGTIVLCFCFWEDDRGLCTVPVCRFCSLSAGTLTPPLSMSVPSHRSASD